MHRALLIPEILRLIIRHLHPTSDKGFENPSVGFAGMLVRPLSKKAARSLVRTSLACKLFLDHALDYLWWFMDDLTPLFRLLSAFKPARNRAKASLIKGVIPPNELQRFNSYACRIRGYHMKIQEPFHPLAITRILRECDRPYLLPALQCLLVHEPANNLYSFIPPSLQYLSASGGSNDSSEELQRYLDLSSLPCIPPILRHLTITSNLTAHCFMAITQLTCLENLSLNQLPAPEGTILNVDLSLIFQMPSWNTLRELRLGEFIRFASPSSSWKGLDTLSFSALKILDITTGAPTIRVLNTLLRSIFLLRLEYLVIRVPPIRHHLDDAERKHWLQFFRVLPEITSRRLTTLKFISIEAHQEPIYWSSLNLSLQDIPDVGRLTSFEVAIPLISCISTSCLKYLVSRWPELTSLKLGSVQLSDLDLHALSFIAQNLPHLRRLAIGLGSEAIIDHLHFPDLEHGLVDLELTLLNTPPPEDLFLLLDELFPTLELYTFQTSGSDFQEEWDDVEDSLHYLKKERENEREDEAAFYEFIMSRGGLARVHALAQLLY
ncbi:hypothetical protein CPB83DRAFT_861066 [Crepidotus variabilis]|uniref:F-box domain-containing protein n=1 Tax=Crepidotus variabilis TaxID=179855 RepID=A0A9P6JL94_9AGAR|nr:hypothetical protein CPB83DRAFT_861066 [Crepidotus variabilis]